MNVQQVDKNHYARALRSRNMPYNIRQRELNNQNDRVQKPNIPPQQSSLPTNHVHAKYEPYLAKHVVRRSAHTQHYQRSRDL